MQYVNKLHMLSCFASTCPYFFWTWILFVIKCHPQYMNFFHTGVLLFTLKVKIWSYYLRVLSITDIKNLRQIWTHYPYHRRKVTLSLKQYFIKMSYVWEPMFGDQRPAFYVDAAPGLFQDAHWFTGLQVQLWSRSWCRGTPRAVSVKALRCH